MEFDLCVITWETILSIALVIFGICQFYKQYKLEKKIAKQSSKISLYQYRFECYKKLVEVHSILSNLGSHTLLDTHSTDIDKLIAEKLTEGRDLIFSAYLESCLLFSNDLSEIFKRLRNQYSDIYEAIFLMLSDNRNRMDKVKEIVKIERYSVDALLALPNKNYSEADEMFLTRKNIYKIFPEIEKYGEAFRKFYEILDSDKFKDLIENYMTLKDIEKEIQQTR